MVKIGSNPRNRCTHILYSLLNPVNESKTVESLAFFLRVLISQSIRNECQLLSELFLIYFSFKSIVALRAILRIYDLWSFFLLDPDPILHFPTNDQKVFAIYTHTKLANSHDVILNFFAQFNYRICEGIFLSVTAAFYNLTP